MKSCQGGGSGRDGEQLVRLLDQLRRIGERTALPTSASSAANAIPDSPLPFVTAQPPPSTSGSGPGSSQGSHNRHAPPAFTHSRSPSGPVQSAPKRPASRPATA